MMMTTTTTIKASSSCSYDELKKSDMLSSDEIEPAIRQSRLKPLLPVSEEIVAYVKEILPEGWAEQMKYNTVYNPKRVPAFNLDIQVPGTGYHIFIENPVRDGTFCKLSTKFMTIMRMSDDDAPTTTTTTNHSLILNDFCEFKEKLDDIFKKVYSRIETWDVDVCNVLKMNGFEKKNDGQYTLMLGDDVNVHAVASLFPFCDGVFLRKNRSSDTTTADADLPKKNASSMMMKDWEVLDLYMLHGMIAALKANPRAVDY